MATLGSDKLKPENRAFYESVKWKTLLSLLYFGTSLMFLGFVAQSGGRANWGRNFSLSSIFDGLSDDSLVNTFLTVRDGYAFATACFFVAFVLALASSIYISPYITGTQRERDVIMNPGGYENILEDAKHNNNNNSNSNSNSNSNNSSSNSSSLVLQNRLP